MHARDSDRLDALLKKLNHRPGMPVTVLGAPPEVVPLVDAWAAETKVKRRLGKNEAFVLAFLRTSAELAERLPKVVTIDADWSALRFRRAEHISRLDRDPSRLLSAEGRRRSKVAGDPP